jgi:hypothetical protein
MNPRRIRQQILQYKSTGHRGTGRAKRRWEDDLETEHAVTAYLQVAVVDDDDESGFFFLLP